MKGVSCSLCSTVDLTTSLSKDENELLASSECLLHFITSLLTLTVTINTRISTTRKRMHSRQTFGVRAFAPLSFVAREAVHRTFWWPVGWMTRRPFLCFCHWGQKPQHSQSCCLKLNNSMDTIFLGLVESDCPIILHIQLVANDHHDQILTAIPDLDKLYFSASCCQNLRASKDSLSVMS